MKQFVEELKELIPKEWDEPGYPEVEEREDGIVLKCRMVIPSSLSLTPDDGVCVSMRDYLCRGLSMFLESHVLKVRFQVTTEPHNVEGWYKAVGMLYILHA